MPDYLTYHIDHKNAEDRDIEISITDYNNEVMPGVGVAEIDLQASDEPNLAPAVMEAVAGDDDKMTAIISKKLRIGFNSMMFTESLLPFVEYPINAKTFSDGSDNRFKASLETEGGAIPFVGNISLDGNTEAYMPRPNPVLLTATDGLNSLKTVELTESDGDIPIGHYRVIDYIYLSLLNLTPEGEEPQINVIMNLYEEDTDPEVSHAFIDTYLWSLTFENGAVDRRDDCFTVLEKICDAFGCFICYDHEGWWVIRWDEYDQINSPSPQDLRVARFDGITFLGYDLVDLTKKIAHDQSGDYEGYRLSLDDAQIRFQRKAGKVVHTYKLEQPIEVPCNSGFTRGTVDDDVLPLKTYVPDCWTLRRGWPGDYEASTVEMRIGVRYNANDYEEERYLYLTPAASGVDDPPEYAESEPIEVFEKDKFEFSINWRTGSVAPGALGNQHSLARIRLHGNDGSDWLLGNEDINDDTTPLKWYDTTNFTANLGAGDRDIDTTVIEEQEWQSIDLGESPPCPVTGKLYILLEQFNQTVSANDDLEINYSDLRFTYIPYINGTYHKITAQENKVEIDSDSRLVIEKEMFISDSPRPILKGALKKFDGVNYVLTGLWSVYDNVDGLVNVTLAKHVVFAWWNQFDSTRTVIDSSFQGINSNDEFGTPGFIHRWKIMHDEETEKHFRLTSLRSLNFRTGGWSGVLVETSNGDGDRNYADPWEFKYIQGE